MKNNLLIFCFLICLKSYGQHKMVDENKIVSIDTTKIAVLTSELTQKYIFQKKCKEAKLNEEEAVIIETLLKKCIGEYNINAEKEFKKVILENPNNKPDKDNFVIDIEKYKRQYIVVTNSKGEKEVWINCFCHTWKKDWKKEIIKINDGGNCYFNLKVNLTKNKYYDLSVNGDA